MIGIRLLELSSTRILRKELNMRTRTLGLAAIAGSLLLTSAGAHAYTLLGSKWQPGPNDASFLPGDFGTPGSATWSIMGAGLGMAPLSDPHGGSLTDSFGSLVGTSALTEEIAMITAAFATWSAVSGFTSLGMVADGGVAAGALESAGGHLGDIRFASVHIDGTFGVLAHAYQPFTEADFLEGTVGGDTHFDHDETWVDEALDLGSDPDFDFQTVALHEIGHALGLGHSSVVGSVMEPIYAGGRRTLHADDIAGIRAIYGMPAAVPEPATMAALGLGAMAMIRRRRAK